MANGKERDYITVEDEEGIEQQFSVEGLFDMEEQTYALLKSAEDVNETIVMQVENKEGEQYLVGINDQDKTEMILDAYEIAVESNPAE
ncbi:DUF1292 domain-containing protein [Bacillus seohaeanensis]|jgi:uncharacterized protein YrzB (UPF0473 family)|uniref:DUF1292 domain-containing protein n=1 Tax=Bacillus seohaeanensis TaxID=284580 RepID=A0ABW5RUP9_9BACI